MNSRCSHPFSVFLSGVLLVVVVASANADEPKNDADAVRMGTAKIFTALQADDEATVVRALELAPYATHSHVFLPIIAKLTERESTRLYAVRSANQILDKTSCGEMDTEWLAYDGRYAARCFARLARDVSQPSELRVQTLEASFSIQTCAGRKPHRFLSDEDPEVVSTALDFFSAPFSHEESARITELIDTLDDKISVQSAATLCQAQTELPEAAINRIRELVLDKRAGSAYLRTQASLCLANSDDRENRVTLKKLRATVPRRIRIRFPHLRKP